MVSDAQVEAAVAAFYGDESGQPIDVAECMRAALEVAERTAWRPISEAADDLEYADLWVVGFGNGWREAGCYRRGTPAVWVTSRGWEATRSGALIITHFRPLPQPPVT